MLKFWGKRKEVVIHKGITCTISAIKPPGMEWMLLMTDLTENGQSALTSPASEITGCFRRKVALQALGVLTGPPDGTGPMPMEHLRGEMEDRCVSHWELCIGARMVSWIKAFRGLDDGDGRGAFEDIQKALLRYWRTGRF